MLNFEFFFIHDFKFDWNSANTEHSLGINSINSLFRQQWRSRPICSWRGCQTRIKLRFDKFSALTRRQENWKDAECWNNCLQVAEINLGCQEHDTEHTYRWNPLSDYSPLLCKWYHILMFSSFNFQVSRVFKDNFLSQHFEVITFSFQNLCDNFPWLWSKRGASSSS